MRNFAVFSMLLMMVFALPHVDASSSLIDPNVPAIDVHDMFNKVNALRQSKGRALLTLNDALTRAAQEQADYISNTGVYAHVRNGSSPGDRALNAGYQTTEWCCSENTHRTQVGKSAWLFWNQSTPHYYNMVNSDWTEIGVATSTVGSWRGWVLVFGAGVQSDIPQAVTTETPAETTASLEIAAPLTTTTNSTYRVTWGDTLLKIAQSHGVSLGDLKAANGLSSDLIYPGQILQIPLHSPAPQTGSTIPALPPLPVNAQIISPAHEASLSPGFAIWGTARFDTSIASFYKVEINGGQFGESWLTVGETHQQSIENGQLEFLHPVQPGQYHLRLVIVGVDGSHLQQTAVTFNIR